MSATTFKFFIVRTSDRDGFKKGQIVSRHKSRGAAEKELSRLVKIGIKDMTIKED